MSNSNSNPNSNIKAHTILGQVIRTNYLQGYNATLNNIGCDNLKVTKLLTAANIVVNNDMNILGGLGISGSVQIDGGIGITGNETILGSINGLYENYNPSTTSAYITNNNITNPRSNNTAYGSNVLLDDISSGNNTGFGSQALAENTVGTQNTAIGSISMAGSTGGSNNTAIGHRSLNLNINGDSNTALGAGTLASNTTGFSNTAAGYFALNVGNTGHDNTAFGVHSMVSMVSGVLNVGVGSNVLNNNVAGANNACFGYNSGYFETGSSNTYIGYNTGCTGPIGTCSNVTCLGANATPSSNIVTNEITLGNGSIAALRCEQTTITTLSDSRDKADIQDLDLGIDFIDELKPSKFKWDKREWYDGVKDGSKMSDCWTAGFIAQDLKEIQEGHNASYLKLVYDVNPDKLEATAGNLLPIIIKALQDLHNENKKLVLEIEILKSKIQ
ncbi:MAG: hypothetical protein Gaeavirus9_14 [Gaeavirus sp.]|uniref:Peptidase S74 domain-containing protein n=1 Tax=Gaeavirus sp. TaxID=2487767 RepID=A0A3G5A0U6_9VIRU|nr:MAG: hypothetical protein Gaeavirus9_14 [Gaeavirus sp.]